MEADDLPPLHSFVAGRVPLAGADDQAALVRQWSGDVGDDCRLVGLGLGFSEAGVMAGDRLFDRLAEIVPQVPTIGLCRNTTGVTSTVRIAWPSHMGVRHLAAWFTGPP